MDDYCDSNSIEKISDNGEEKDECGLCSPFISCGTCAGFIAEIAEPLTAVLIQPEALSNLFGLSFKSAETEYAERLWQPPKRVIIS